MQTPRNLRHAALLAAGLLTPLAFARAQASPPASAAAPEPLTGRPVDPTPPKAPAEITLKAASQGIFYVGVAIRPDQVNGQNPRSAELITREFNSISPENVMKMGPIHPRPGNDPSSYNFGPADEFVEFGVKNNLVIIGHNLCWHSQMPAWMSQPDAGQDSLTKEVLLARLREHIMTVAGRYKGRIHGWDVVNEAINDGEGDYRPSVFYRIIGKEYLALAFKWAHEADPAAELYYNDYNLDANDKKRATAIELVQYLRDQGAPIHGIGLQGHYNLNSPTVAKIDETIRMFSNLGLKVHITELDVRATDRAPLTAAVGGPAASSSARSGRGPLLPGRPLPPIDVLKNVLMLTDAQVARIEPLLAADTQNIETAGADRTRLDEARNATVAAIRQLLDAAQQSRFTLLLTPPPGGGRGPAGPPPPLTAAQQQALAKRYGEIFQVFLKHPSVVRVTFWGLRDADSWRRADSPLLFDEAYGRKPAYDAVIQALAGAGVRK